MLFIIIGALIVVSLSLLAIYYLVRLKQHNKKMAVHQAQSEKTKLDRETYIIQSISILSRGLLVGQVTLTEASIRIAGLLDSLELPDKTKEDCLIFTQLAKACEHIPILDAWKSLSKKDKQRLTRERESVEKKYKDFVMAAANKIVKGEISFLDNQSFS